MHHRCIASSGARFEQIDDLLRRTGFAQPREDPRDAVNVGIQASVGHRVDSQRDVRCC